MAELYASSELVGSRIFFSGCDGGGGTFSMQ